MIKLDDKITHDQVRIMADAVDCMVVMQSNGDTIITPRPKARESLARTLAQLLTIPTNARPA